MRDPRRNLASLPSNNQHTMQKTLVVAGLALVVGSFAVANADTPPPSPISTNLDTTNREVYRVERIDPYPVLEAPTVDVPREAPKVEPPKPAPVVEKPQGKSNDCTLPASAISSTDSIQNFAPANGRFSKVPAYLVPIYEKACEDYRIPVRYLAADGSYETHFNANKIGDSGNSCGIHQFNRQNAGKKWPRNWGFRDLNDCLNPTSNIRKTAEFWRSMLDKKNVCNGNLSCAVRRHNGVDSHGYMRTVMGAADRYYR